MIRFWLPVRTPRGRPRMSTMSGVAGVLVLLPVLQGGEVGRDRHHHPEHGRDGGQQAQAGQEQQDPQLADAGTAPAGWARRRRCFVEPRERKRGGRGGQAGLWCIAVVGHPVGRCGLTRRGRIGERAAPCGPHRRGAESSIAPGCPIRFNRPPRWPAARSTILPAGGLEDKLREGRPLRVKLGIDPTSADIHLGHVVVLQKLRDFQDAGHVVVLIVGDYTARVGDPSGRSTMRPVVSGEQIDANALTYQEQAFKVLDPDPAKVEVRRNGEWLDMPAEDLFRLARVATVAQILERDDFAGRYASGAPISVLELLYPLLQGYDSVAIRADVELGGTDQKFNLLLGRDVQTRLRSPRAGDPDDADPPRDRRQAAHGQVAGQLHRGRRAARGDVRQGHERPRRGHGQVLGAAVVRDSPPPGLEPRDAKRALARAHRGALPRRGGRRGGRARTSTASTSSTARPRRSRRRPSRRWTASVHLPALIAEVFGLSRSEARRLLGQGGVRLDGEPLGAGRPGPAGRAAGRSHPPGRQAPLPPPAPELRPRGHPRGRAAALHGRRRACGGPHRGRRARRRHLRGAHGRRVRVRGGLHGRGDHHGARAGRGRRSPGAAGPAHPARERYEHNVRNADTNAHAHLRAALVGPSESIPVVEGRLALGTWQQVVLVDFDDSPRTGRSSSTCS